MKIKEGLSKILFFIIAGIVGVLVNHFYTKYQNRTHYIEYSFDSKNLSEITDHSFNIKFDSINVSNLYRIEFELFNFDERDAEDVPVYIDFHGNEKGAAKILYSEVWGNGFTKESLDKIDGLAKSDYDNFCGFRDAHIINHGRKGDLNNPIFRGLYFVDANDISDVKVVVDKSGYQERAFEWDNYYNSSLYPKDLIDHWYGAIIYFLFGVMILMIMLAIYNRIFPPKVNENWLKIISLKISHIANQKLTPKEIEREYIKTKERYDWDNNSKFLRFFQGYKKPD